MTSSDANGDRAREPRTALTALMAVGCSGPWHLNVDEAISGPDRWFMQIVGPGNSLYFEIEDTKIVTAMVEFFARPFAGRTAWDPATGVLILSRCGDAAISLTRDDEFEDRYFLSYGCTDGTRFELTIAGHNLTEFVNAVKNLEQDLD